MFSASGRTITMTRGDTVRIKVSIFSKDGKQYNPDDGDTIRFAAKKNYSDANVLINKPIPKDTLILELNPEDTKSLDFGDYVFDIQLTHSNGDIDTFINKGLLTITEEVD